MKTCPERRRVVCTLAAMGIAGPAIIPRAEANPLVWALRTLFSRALTTRQVQVLTHQVRQAFASQRTPLPAAAMGHGVRRAALKIGDHLLPDFDCSCDVCPCQTEQVRENEASLQYAERPRAIESETGIEAWDASKAQSLFLKVPSSSRYIDDVLVLALTDLRSGKKMVIEEQRLALLPNTDDVFLTVPVKAVSARGPHKFDALIPALAGEIVIKSSPPVMLQ
ncbi:MAG: hypothetical protein AB8B87_20910 [Granulosicoccus sp.]